MWPHLVCWARGNWHRDERFSGRLGVIAAPILVVLGELLAPTREIVGIADHAHAPPIESPQLQIGGAQYSREKCLQVVISGW